ncbi:hypothetical protein BDR06DRAFT_1011443 [Suillus hirtellus]|nr:hypothetical protein BDR06DRAFT_1011443 [Suillus hirtellus]
MTLPCKLLRALPPPLNSMKIWPTRDSPNNPFLASEDEASASGWENSDDELAVGEVIRRERTLTFEEGPTMTGVCRGQKFTICNPQYRLPLEVLKVSKLPIDHPDFEASEACPPHQLFANKRLKCKSHDISQNAPPVGSLSAGHAKVEYLDASASEGTASTNFIR